MLGEKYSDSLSIFSSTRYSHLFFKQILQKKTTNDILSVKMETRSSLFFG